MKQASITVSRRSGWRMAWAIVATTIRAYLDGSRTITFSMEEEVNS